MLRRGEVATRRLPSLGVMKTSKTSRTRRPTMTEAWLRGPVDGVPAPLMPAAHSLIDAVEDIERAVEGLSPERLWLAPGGAASIGFHLKHVPGSIDRLLTYARGGLLTSQQLAAIPREQEPGEPPAELDELLSALRDARDRALDAYRATDAGSLLDSRSVGRAALPSTVQGLLFHAAEHARRHAGQVVATARIVRGLEL
jgi:uncharacterized damage-inducible protein DinB